MNEANLPQPTDEEMEAAWNYFQAEYEAWAKTIPGHPLNKN